MNLITFFRKYLFENGSFTGLAKKRKEMLLRVFSRKMTPEALALSIALGLVLGVFPVLGCPTLLCAAAAGALRLNAAAVQAVNYLAYPLQLALLAPFLSLGGWLFQAGTRAAAAPRLSAILHGDPLRAATALCAAAGHAVAGWFCVCAPVGLLLYAALACFLRRSSARTPAPSEN